ncbi:uncharacterized protein LOC119937815 [Tachyglossus aculeatus]|uniref:uncharacterized protein LOC119937815 n=1 Tax=Tachyglossus aculeatus TaxID=9261 RepID=UPI0018F4195C|nr:uncharacterized protein LOC119937815 [Tachyglossus aculeatus]
MNLTRLADWYVQRAAEFIRWARERGAPFLLYLAPAARHIPLPTAPGGWLGWIPTVPDCGRWTGCSATSRTMWMRQGEGPPCSGSQGTVALGLGSASCLGVWDRSWEPGKHIKMAAASILVLTPSCLGYHVGSLADLPAICLSRLGSTPHSAAGVIFVQNCWVHISPTR